MRISQMNNDWALNLTMHGKHIKIAEVTSTGAIDPYIRIPPESIGAVIVYLENQLKKQKKIKVKKKRGK